MVLVAGLITELVEPGPCELLLRLTFSMYKWVMARDEGDGCVCETAEAATDRA